ncbi:MAG: hypothetical protein CK429_13630 [Mycobacterium sp.]|nr:MAG: hypothetical protein CK429_13630 [Mycobacterium sp.]
MAQRANLSERYFYTEFATKDDLLDCCAEKLFGRLYAQMEEVVNTASLAVRVAHRRPDRHRLRSGGDAVSHPV